jgi:hypothetical protein
VRFFGYFVVALQQSDAAGGVATPRPWLVFLRPFLTSRPSVRGPTAAFLFSSVKKGSKKTFLYFLSPVMGAPLDCIA